MTGSHTDAAAERAKILRRIRKCMALAAGSDEPGEAAAALSAAQAIMRKYGITADDVDLSEISEMEVGASGTADLAQWDVQLIDCVRTTFGVGALFSEGVAQSRSFVRARPGDRHGHFRVNRGRGKVIFIGPENRVAVAVYAYSALRRQLQRARRAHRQRYRASPTALDTFCLGWVLGVRDKLAKLAIPFPADPRVATYVEGKHRTKVMSGRVAALDDQHMLHLQSGLIAARDAVLNAGVGGQHKAAALPETRTLPAPNPTTPDSA